MLGLLSTIWVPFLSISAHVGGSPKLGVPSGDPHKKDHSALGSTLGPLLGKLPFWEHCFFNSSTQAGICCV